MNVLLRRIPPGPTFSIVEEKKGDTYWAIQVCDGVADDIVHYKTRNPEATMSDVLRAGARKIKTLGGILSVQRVENGIPVIAKWFMVAYVFGKWTFIPMSTQHKEVMDGN